MSHIYRPCQQYAGVTTASRRHDYVRFESQEHPLCTRCVHRGSYCALPYIPPPRVHQSEKVWQGCLYTKWTTCQLPNKHKCLFLTAFFSLDLLIQRSSYKSWMVLKVVVREVIFASQLFKLSNFHSNIDLITLLDVSIWQSRSQDTYSNALFKSAQTKFRWCIRIDICNCKFTSNCAFFQG